MAPDVERRIVYPDRSAAAGRQADQPLAQPRDGRDPFGEQALRTGQIEGRAGREYQYRRDLLRYPTAVHRQTSTESRERDQSSRKTEVAVNAATWDMGENV